MLYSRMHATLVWDQLPCIDLPGEQQGSIASKKLKLQTDGEQWYLGDSCNTAIGQGLTRVSPLQMVTWVSAIANGGTVYEPHIAKTGSQSGWKDS